MRLGCLNHALLTREAIRSSGLPFAGWIANKMAVEMPLANANIESLTTRFRVPPLAVVPPGATLVSDPIPPWAEEAANKLVSA